MRRASFLLGILAAGILAAPVLADPTAPPLPPAPTGTTGITPPIAANKHTAGEEDYPPLSRAMNEQGRVLLRFVIDETGKVRNAVVEKSSGYPRLDAASIDLLQNRWLYHPAMKDGKPIAVTSEVAVNWKLTGTQNDPGAAMIVMKPEDFPAGARERHEEGTVVVMVLVSIDGTVGDADIYVSSGYPDLDEAAQNYARARKKIAPAMIDGKPAITVIPMTIVWMENPPPPG